MECNSLDKLIPQCACVLRIIPGQARSTQMNHAEMQFLTTEFPFKKQYGNFIGGKWVQPVGNEYFDNVSPITGEPFTSIPRSREADIELALDAAHRAKAAWGKT